MGSYDGISALTSRRKAFPGDTSDKESACQCRRLWSLSVAQYQDSIPGPGRAPGEGHDNPTQYSCLENPCTELPGGLQSMGLQRVRHN